MSLIYMGDSNKCPDCNTEMETDEKNDSKCPNCGLKLYSYKGPDVLEFSGTFSVKDLDPEKVAKDIVDNMIKNFKDDK